MEELQPQSIQSECPNPNIPRYDRAHRCFTRVVPSLRECALKQMPRVLVPNLEGVKGDTLNTHASTIENILKRIPTELHEPIAFNFMLHAAQHGYKMIFYKQKQRQSFKEDYLTCGNDAVLDFSFNSSGTIAAISLKNGSIQFFQKKNSAWKGPIWKSISDNNTTTFFHITRFFDDTTCVSYNRNTANVLTVHTFTGELLQSSPIPLESSICTISPNKKNILLFIDSANNLFCCLKYQSSVRVQKIMTLTSDEECTSIVSDGNFFNYVLSTFSENPTLNVIGLVDNDIRSIKRIEVCKVFPIKEELVKRKKIYIKNFRKGFLHLAKIIKDNKSFDGTIFEHHAIDVNSETSIATFNGRFDVKPMLNLPCQAVLAQIALKNSYDPAQLTAWESSSVVKNLPEELKNQLMEEYNKAYPKIQ